MTLAGPFPLPVSGSVSLSGPTNVSVSNTPTVNVGSLPPVTATVTGTSNVAVTNDTTRPVPTLDLGSPGRHPFTSSCGNASGPGPGAIACSPPSGPPGAEVVIQDINITCISNGTNMVFASFSYAGGGNGATFNFPGVVAGVAFAGAGPTTIAHQLVTLYADPNSPFSCTAQFAQNTSSIDMSCVVSGYTVTQ